MGATGLNGGGGNITKHVWIPNTKEVHYSSVGNGIAKSNNKNLTLETKSSGGGKSVLIQFSLTKGNKLQVSAYDPNTSAKASTNISYPASKRDRLGAEKVQNILKNTGVKLTSADYQRINKELASRGRTTIRRK